LGYSGICAKNTPGERTSWSFQPDFFSPLFSAQFLQPDFFSPLFSAQFLQPAG
jgi:hypothetical protein